jgi:hypothetical protein
MALAVDPEKHGMPTVDEWADSVFGPLHFEVGPGDPQLGLPDFVYNDGVEAAGAPAGLAPGYGLDAVEDAAGPGLLAAPLDAAGGDGIDWADGLAVLPPAMFGQDLLQDVSFGQHLLRWEDVAAQLTITDAYDDGDLDIDAGLATWAAAFAQDGIDRTGANAAAMMAPASGLDVMSWPGDDEQGLFAPLLVDGAGDGVDAGAAV